MKKRVAGQIATLATVIALSAIAAAPAAQAEDPNVVQARNCRGVFTFTAADAEIVREEGEIPKRWKLQEPTGSDHLPGSAELFLAGISCEAAPFVPGDPGDPGFPPLIPPTEPTEPTPDSGCPATIVELTKEKPSDEFTETELASDASAPFEITAVEKPEKEKGNPNKP